MCEESMNARQPRVDLMLFFLCVCMALAGLQLGWKVILENGILGRTRLWHVLAPLPLWSIATLVAILFTYNQVGRRLNVAFVVGFFSIMFCLAGIWFLWLSFAGFARSI